MSNTVGTPEKLTLDGITFDFMADANLNQIKGKYTNESIPTSGRNLNKKTVRSQNVESVNIAANSEEAKILEELSERKTPFPMSYSLASGDVFRTTGNIEFEGHDTETGVAALQLQPESSDGFTAFIV